MPVRVSTFGSNPVARTAQLQLEPLVSWVASHCCTAAQYPYSTPLFTMRSMLTPGTYVVHIVVWGLERKTSQRYLIDVFNQSGMRTADAVVDQVLEMCRAYDPVVPFRSEGGPRFRGPPSNTARS
jgi:hypothetical protein